MVVTVEVARIMLNRDRLALADRPGSRGRQSGCGHAGLKIKKKGTL